MTKRKEQRLSASVSPVLKAKERKRGLRPEGYSGTQRIKKRGEFLKVQSGGKKFRSSHLLLICSPQIHSNHDGLNRLGITVTTKVDKRAVARNLLKRRIREVFRKELRASQTPHDLVFIALNGATAESFESIESQVLSLAKRARLFPGHRPGSSEPKSPKERKYREDGGVE